MTLDYRAAVLHSTREPLVLDFPLLVQASLGGKLRLDELITNRIPLDKINEGFEDLRRGKTIRTVVIFD
jgi:S-(hydroxymethyl)glutathione dehydrogenase/alcohol dehydrogenase